ncbi:winged helix-turn-helix domain-containing protein [Roseomonas sp. CECT 9278]|uniref:winged helix-turn-helix domain-containing protein n=1 Tax=Roseomonas sp. CECT 9278 TaxID=2845823 RepID=UPI001E42488E|nr:winged helix-turn-helix domain-containing protein [Roseomonas sp. CECT 9278]CAH0127862.1 hypothetical protein ROS9278_00147 [Roseomonas sp. CECT 9278]
MDAYLDIAVTILRAERRPLSSHAILAEAHRAGLVPPTLYGKTQHKTLGARISEDILSHRDRSRFFRTAPGRYFLREFLEDPSIPNEHRQPFPARRRIRELSRGPALAVTEESVRVRLQDSKTPSTNKILNLLRKQHRAYLDPKKAPNALFVRSFVCVCRGSSVLSYRLGRYRDDRDTFMHKRSIGFTTLIHVDEHTLFNVGDMGIVEAGIRAVKIDLDIPPAVAEENAASDEAELRKFVWVSHVDGRSDLLAIIRYGCPQWFEPVKRRLALNDIEWIDVHGINNIEDYDPWSRCVLESYNRVAIFAESRRG